MQKIIACLPCPLTCLFCIRDCIIISNIGRLGNTVSLTMIQRIISLIIGYFFGSVLTAVIVTRAKTGKDISEIGSGNPGMANVMAKLGKKAGFTVLFGDIIKTVLGLFVSWLLFRDQIGSLAPLYAGLGAVIGHNHPFWRKFRGGKGVTVSVTWLILLMPIYGAIVSIIGGIITLITGYLPLGAVLIALMAVPVAFALYGTEYGIVMSASALLMLSRHYRGLLRIIRGEEKREFHRGKK